MIKIKTIYQLNFYLIILLVFVFGGLLQFLVGLSNTKITFIIVGIMFITYLFYAFKKGKILLNDTFFIFLSYIIVVIISAIVNKSDTLSTIIYLIFPFLPFGAFFFAYINYKEGYLSQIKIFKLLYYIALIQLPFLLIQKNFYEFLIQFNNSKQTIASYDFMFGTFFIKSDHSLALFVLFVVISILFNVNGVKRYLKLPWFSVLYLGITIFLTESNISKLFFILLCSIVIIVPLYKRYRNNFRFKLAALFLAGIILYTGYNIRDQQIIQKRLGGKFEKQFSVESAYKFYNEGTAKREQIVIVAFKKLDTKWIGDGPYSYFNIRTGMFKKAPHFTQLIWTYFDLGLIGLVIVICYLISLVKYLNINRGIAKFAFLGTIFVYAFYTTIFSDIAIMFSLFMIFNKQMIIKVNT